MAAQLLQASFDQATGHQTTGVISVDVMALGALISATDQPLVLADGTSFDGPALTTYLLSGIYDQFPSAADTAQREHRQVEIGQVAVKQILKLANPRQLISAVAAQLAVGRIRVWSGVEEEQKMLSSKQPLDNLRAEAGPNLFLTLINASGSKLDAYLQRSVDYRISRCTAAEGRGLSVATAALVSELPAGRQLPAYMVGMAPMGATGPINRTLVQFHLPLGAEVQQVTLDGQPWSFTPFVEQDRPALVLTVDLPPSRVRTIQVSFYEPPSADRRWYWNNLW